MAEITIIANIGASVTISLGSESNIMKISKNNTGVQINKIGVWTILYEFQDIRKICKVPIERMDVDYIVDMIGDKFTSDDNEIEIYKLKKKIEELTESNKFLESENDTLSNKVIDLTNNIIILESTNTDLTKSNELITNEKNKLEDQVSDLANNNRELNNQIDILTGENNEYESKISILESDKESLNTQINTLTEREEELSTQIDTLTSEKESLNIQINTLTEKEEKLNTQINTLTAEKEELNTRIDTLTEEKTSLNNRISDLIAENNTLKDSNGAIASLTEENNKLKESNENLSNQINELNSEKEELNTTINTLTEEKDSLSTQINTLTTEKEELNTTITTLTEEKTSLSARVDSLTTEKEELNTQVNTLTEEKNSLNIQLDEMTSTKNDLEIEKELLEEQVTTLTTEKESLKEQVDNLTEQINSGSSINPDVLASLQDQVDSIGTQVIEVSKELDEMKLCINDIMDYCQGTVGGNEEISVDRIEEIIVGYGFSVVYRDFEVNTNKGSLVTISLVDTETGEEKVIRSYSSENRVNRFRLAPGTYKVTSTLVGSDDVYTDSVTVEIGDEDKVYTAKISHVPGGAVTYGIEIDTSNSDPDTSVTYIENAEDMIPMSVDLNTGVPNYGDWEDIITDWIGCKPCMLNTSDMSVEYLNPDDYTKLEDGSPSNITSTSSGKVAMVEFSQKWYRWSVDESNSNIIRFEVSNYDRSDEGFTTAAFKAMDGSGEIKDTMYYSIFEGTVASNKLISVSDVVPSASVTYANFHNYAKANGQNFEMEDLARRYYIIGLLYLVSKSRYGQSKFGTGILGVSASVKNGTLNDKGLFYGRSSATAIKVFGIENFYGNFWTFINGIHTKNTSGGIVFKDEAPYNDAGTGYSDENYTAPVTGSWFYPGKMKSYLNGAIILPVSSVSGAANNNWTDQTYVNKTSGCVGYVGGGWGDAAGRGGPLCLVVSSSPSRSYSDFSARLVAC